ncbi:MAG: CD225/dispanin family protein [Tannerella sp.]|nr:CD225/dispanin family protein [Tannerella sp.]
MEKEYFYLDGETKVGPLSLDALKYAPVRPSTLVWNNTLPDWVEAGTLPELESLFTSADALTPPPPPPVYNQSNAFGGANVQPMPENYLVWAILTTVLCCLPFGIASIVNATKVSSVYATGDYAGAQKASRDAKKWAIWSAVSAGIFWVIYLVVIVALGIAGVAAGGLGLG